MGVAPAAAGTGPPRAQDLFNSPSFLPHLLSLPRAGCAPRALGHTVHIHVYQEPVERRARSQREGKRAAAPDSAGYAKGSAPITCMREPAPSLIFITTVKAGLRRPVPLEDQVSRWVAKFRGAVSGSSFLVHACSASDITVIGWRPHAHRCSATCARASRSKAANPGTCSRAAVSLLPSKRAVSLAC